ncbi:hypothetical protein SAMN05428947_12417 [Mucilaginibacter sp. OK283]|jgi:hypothetical protein|nr:hypothetical protein SAMN05428947_12417 [Mucilaginibacter sp. OK283]
MRLTLKNAAKYLPGLILIGILETSHISLKSAVANGRRNNYS